MGTERTRTVERRTTTNRRRLSADDWIEEALETLADRGADAIAVEPLAEALGVTKGSFYAHFSNRDDLVVAALDRWEQHDSAHIHEILTTGGEPRRVLRRLIREMFGDYEAGRLYAGVCAAGTDPVVSPYAIDHALRKVELLTDLFRQAGLSRTEAQRRGELTYTAYIGHWRIRSMFPPEEPGVLQGYLSHLEKTLIPT